VTLLRSGSTKKYADGWDAAFGKKRSSAKKTATKKTSAANKAKKKKR
jgi:hypothetical protein